ncbi:MAG: SusD/RagB family nutrient-binding outer membrane lipoprotein [Gracilimonas sp.]|uniref:SusD/RagB family nutrient-binding outer membrane lipoprotein n=1 Tax=Gracilimonas TaxID=649462 RepID=UPI001B0C8E41|nr:SusD/RagB family nutrient-binding outer membrane lipoprotein [Gracilimonas sp.]MBO6585674.1 SusD/RagB family nutrient-binding outer membrane lipoprotein [Gracilimonas sp.]MBO6616671.1 SusD/RagB family nutrient-binding outer membrane lipoprotein [Gracilimonas sp.]
MKKLFIPITLIAFAIFSSCDLVEFNNINNNPNQPSDAAAPQLIANAMLSLPGLSSSPNAQYMAQYLAETQYVDASLYPEGGTSFYGWYQGPLVNLKTAEEVATTENQKAVARILKAYIFWNVTDRWGDIPYSEALQGTEEFTPVYDTQESIYEDLFAELKAAADQIDESGSLSNDIIYEGDMGKWVKFSNSLRLLMALRLSEVNASLAETEFNDALNDGVFTSNEDNFLFQHLADANNQNYWYGQIVDPPIREWWALTVSLVDLMNPYNDPRLPVYGNEVRNGGGYAGLQFGEEDSIGTEDFSLLGSDIYAQDAPVYLVTYAEVLFARAEAAALNWTTEDPATNYNDAIENSIAQWTGDASQATAYLAQPDITFDPGNAVEQISTQRYIHLFMHGYQAWAEWRRTGYPDNLVQPNGNAVPLRQSYTSDEALNNTENYEEAIQRQFGGENSIYGRLWWDQD